MSGSFRETARGDTGDGRWEIVDVEEEIEEEDGVRCQSCGELAAQGAAYRDTPTGNTCIRCKKRICYKCAGKFDDVCLECEGQDHGNEYYAKIFRVYRTRDGLPDFHRIIEQEDSNADTAVTHAMEMTQRALADETWDDDFRQFCEKELQATRRLTMERDDSSIEEWQVIVLYCSHFPRIPPNERTLKFIKCDRPADFEGLGGNCPACGDDLCISCAVKWHGAQRNDGLKHSLGL